MCSSVYLCSCMDLGTEGVCVRASYVCGRVNACT